MWIFIPTLALVQIYGAIVLWKLSRRAFDREPVDASPPISPGLEKMNGSEASIGMPYLSAQPSPVPPPSLALPGGNAV